MTAVPEGSAGPPVGSYEVLLLDLDGTLYLGDTAVAGAADHVLAMRASGAALVFVTNNASRTPDQVVEHLRSVGVVADRSEILTAAQAGARVLAGLVPAGSATLVVGGDGLVEAVRETGLRPVRTAAEGPVAVVQGWWPGLDWAQLAEGAFALAEGVPWVATNDDLTLPTASGVAPGNGSFVRLLSSVTGRTPDAVAGKPGPGLLRQAAAGRRALVVGDRLDTDVEGAVAAGLDSALVLSGVSGVAELLAARAGERPTYVCRDLGGLFRAQPVVRERADDRWECGEAVVARRDELIVRGPGPDPVGDDLLRATCAAAWSLADRGVAVRVGPRLLAALGA